MKATLHFDHDETEELQDAIDGRSWKDVVWNIDQQMRSVIKHGYIKNREATEAEMEVTHYWRDKLRELINEDNLNL
jgi:ribulose bisphosphate carboxylase small subunit